MFYHVLTQRGVTSLQLYPENLGLWTSERAAINAAEAKYSQKLG